jgi:hypothetical protein
VKKVLVIYFTQTGQAKKAIDAVLQPLVADAQFEIHYELIKPKNVLPYPWQFTEFCDAFPENVHGIPFELEPFKTDLTQNFDLIVIGYQPWFLSVCRPVNSFLLSSEAKQLFRNKPVITIINCRNMWLGAQEKMKKLLLSVEAKLVGNIVFTDHSSNLTSLVTVLAFELKGVKEKFMGFFPKYGINQKDLERAPSVGEDIKAALIKGEYTQLQSSIVKNNFVQIKPNLMIMEGRGKAMFPLYANYISKKGTSGSTSRRTRVKIFGFVLPTAILLLSPIITIIARLTPIVAPRKIRNQIAYYQQNSLKTH